MVNWRTYDGEGELAERAICTLLHRRHPDGRRRRPSRGDGGIDFYRRDPVRGLIVDQIKSFSAGLTDSRKRQIRESLERAASIPPDEWRLVLPMDPTTEQEEWFEKLTAPYPFTCNWQGQTFCDNLAADYPVVVEYFFGDGANKYREAIEQLRTLQSGLLPAKPSDAFEPMKVLAKNLSDLSPFYRFDIETHRPFSPGHAHSFFSSKSEPDVVMYKTLVTDAEHATTIKVRPHYAQAVEDDPLLAILRVNSDDLRAAEFGAQPGEPFQFSAETTTALPGEEPVTEQSMVVATPVGTSISSDAVVEVAAVAADGQAISSFILPDCTGYGGVLSPVHTWSTDNGVFQLTVKQLGEDMQTTVNINADNRSAFSVRRIARTLRSGSELNTSLVLRVNGQDLEVLTDHPSFKDELTQFSNWFESIDLLAQLTPLLDYDYAVPDIRICEHDLADLRNAITLATGSLMPSAGNASGLMCLDPAFWKANNINGRFPDAKFSGALEHVTYFDMHFIDEPIVIEQAHYHLTGYQLVEIDDPECTDPDHVTVKIEATESAQCFYHLGEHDSCTWQGLPKLHE